MSETTTAQPTASAEDKKVRAAPTPKPAKTPTTDPGAPFGYMKDPKTGETRPKKRPGKGPTTTAPAPKDRPGGQARTRPATSSKKNYAQDVTALCESVWMLAAAVPEVKRGTKVLGRDVHDLTVRVHAQAEIVNTESDSIVRGLVIMAENSAPVAKGLDKLTAENGPAWVLPAMFALLPFVAQSVTMWRSPVAGDVEALAAQTTTKFGVLIKGVVESDVQPSGNGSAPVS
jgi:hypothetical protein